MNINNNCKPLRSFFTSQHWGMLSVVYYPFLILFIKNNIPDSIPLISFTLAITLLAITFLAKNKFQFSLLKYWVVTSLIYTILLYEFIVVPLAEISALENFFLVSLILPSLFFIYLTSMNSKFIQTENSESTYDQICPMCRIKMQSRNYHCNICCHCISNYDHHSYWLNCCIGEFNLHYYFAGIFLGVFALAYLSLLILTTICSPKILFGILIPEDCTYACYSFESCFCFTSGIYCIELAILLLFKVLYHSWHISTGFSAVEKKKQNKNSLVSNSFCKSSFFENWKQFLKRFRSIHLHNLQ